MSTSIEQRFYVLVSRSQYAYVEVKAESKRAADELVSAMSTEQIFESADDWDWHREPPFVIGPVLTENELLAEPVVPQEQSDG